MKRNCQRENKEKQRGERRMRERVSGGDAKEWARNTKRDEERKGEEERRKDEPRLPGKRELIEYEEERGKEERSERRKEERQREMTT